LTYRHTIDVGLLDQARREAVRRGTTLTALIEQGLRLVIRPPMPAQTVARMRLPVSQAGGGLIAGIDLDDTSAVLDRMEGRG
jgi:hypothetical protein